jgi:hypothetical protein
MHLCISTELVLLNSGSCSGVTLSTGRKRPHAEGKGFLYQLQQYCANVLLDFNSTVPMYCSTVTVLCQITALLLQYCAIVLLYFHSTVPKYCCSETVLCQCTARLQHYCANVLLDFNSTFLLYCCTEAVLRRCTAVL